MAPVPDLTDTEQWVIHTTLLERYGRDWPFELGECPVDLLQAQADCAARARGELPHKGG